MVKVVGYTDTSGPEAYNQYLAQQRAEAVKNYLAEEGIETVEVEARGEENPIASNDDREGRQQNRRVEVTVASTRSNSNRGV